MEEELLGKVITLYEKYIEIKVDFEEIYKLIDDITQKLMTEELKDKLKEIKSSMKTFVETVDHEAERSLLELKTQLNEI